MFGISLLSVVILGLAIFNKIKFWKLKPRGKTNWPDSYHTTSNWQCWTNYPEVVGNPASEEATGQPRNNMISRLQRRNVTGRNGDRWNDLVVSGFGRETFLTDLDGAKHRVDSSWTTEIRRFTSPQDDNGDFMGYDSSAMTAVCWNNYRHFTACNRIPWPFPLRTA